MVKKTFISILLLSTCLHAHAGLNKNPQNYLSPGNIPLDKEAMIYSVSASFNSISLESITTIIFEGSLTLILVETKPIQFGDKSKLAIRGFGFLSANIVIAFTFCKLVSTLIGTTAPFSTSS